MKYAGAGYKIVHTFDTKTKEEKWSSGPWTVEPDLAHFVHKYLPCVMLRHHSLGHWCGYTGVPVGHPLYKQREISISRLVSVHGGPTFVGCWPVKVKDSHTDLYTLLTPHDKYWWVGFDCGHAGDIVPAMRIFLGKRGKDYSHFSSGEGWRGEKATYKDMGYVHKQVIRLADQLAEFGDPKEYYTEEEKCD
jgi:hypothetical protein